MQDFNMKRQRCVNGSCLNSIYGNEIIARYNDQDSQKLPWTCFRLPFCDFIVAQREENRIQEVLETHVPYCSHCGVQLKRESDEEEDDIIHNIPSFVNIGSIVTKLKHPSHIRRNSDEASTIATATITSASNSFHTDIDQKVPSSESRYVSLDSLLRPRKTGGTTTSTEVSSTEFVDASDSYEQEKLLPRCKCCEISLSAQWKYCPSCGIYVDEQTCFQRAIKKR